MFRAQLHVTTALSTGGGPESYVLLAPGPAIAARSGPWVRSAEGLPPPPPPNTLPRPATGRLIPGNPPQLSEGGFQVVNPLGLWSWFSGVVKVLNGYG